MEKFTIIITHYNQMEYIKTAINSVLKQTYKNIEIIVADDCSKSFDKTKINEIIKKGNKRKFEYQVIQGKKNVGTVKNLNNALKKVTGDYVLFFAADDKLANDKVVENFINEFKNKKKNVITSQCGLYDHQIKKKYSDYVNVKKALKLNKKSSNVIYEKMCEGCFYGAGGTAYRKTVFDKHGLFNENYKFVEDWSYWLHILRNGEKIYYADFDTLCHRDGGISHSVYTPETIPVHVRQYYKDILNIYENEVIPYLNRFNTKEKYRILRQYNETILYYSYFVPDLISYLKSFDNARLSDFKLKYYWKYNTLKKYVKNIVITVYNDTNIINKIKILLIYNRVVPITIFAWLLICFFIINNLGINNNNILLIWYLISYCLLYLIIYILDKVIYYTKTILISKLKQNRGKKNVI